MYTRRIPEHVVPGKPLGRHVRHDPRSLDYLVPRQPARALASVLHERKVPIFDQGSVGSCTGNAAVGAVGTDPLFEAVDKTRAYDEALAVKVYSAGTALDDYPGTYPPTDTGCDGLSVAKVCKQLGLISGYLHATSLTATVTALQDTPVIVGVPWYEGFDNPDSTGRVHVSGAVRGGHEFELVGVDVTEKTFLAANSWGTGWGVRGFFTIGFDDMDRLLHEDGDCTQLLPLSVPAPGPTPVNPISAVDAALILAVGPFLKGRTYSARAKAAQTGLSTWEKAHGL